MVLWYGSVVLWYGSVVLWYGSVVSGSAVSKWLW